MCAEAFPVSAGKLILFILPWSKMTWNYELMNIALSFIKISRHFALFSDAFICSLPQLCILALCSWGIDSPPCSNGSKMDPNYGNSWSQREKFLKISLFLINLPHSFTIMSFLLIFFFLIPVKFFSLSFPPGVNSVAAGSRNWSVWKFGRVLGFVFVVLI